ncbi:acetyl-CoA acetyltransferase domain protein [Mycobacterium xenopi 4042]|uniref:Acetyl-CoA acetyltransferase domain protein n=1 Tax=Mycobacterium xenopi 4042 TaxID=1299334 RepID=X8DKN4_MYCXE|nr:acetyl-CoA acetyltransferase domain protein [Mycobacterium xenopi 4042]
MISWPYTKLMNSNNMVDQSAAIILASAEAAARLKVPPDRWIFPHAGTDSHDTYALSERLDYHQSRRSGSRVDASLSSPGWRSGILGSSTSTRAFRPRFKSPRPNSAFRSAIRHVR